MTDLLAIGTRKGLWLARSDDDRRTWTVDGPHFLAREVASVCVDTRRDPPRLLAGIQYDHWGPTVMWSDDLGATWQETEHGAIQFPADTGRRARRGCGSCARTRADRPDVVWAGCEPHLAVAQRRRRQSFELVRGLWDHPHRPKWGAGDGGAAVHTVLPDPASDRVMVAMSTGGVYVSEDGGEKWEPRNHGISVAVHARPEPGVRPVRAQGGRRRQRPGPAVRAEPPRRLPLGRRRRLLDVDRRRAARRLRLPDPRLAAHGRAPRG